MNTQEFVNKLNEISERFSAEVQDNQQKKEMLESYRSSVSGKKWSITLKEREITQELDLSTLKQLKSELQQMEDDLNEVGVVIHNLEEYMRKYTDRLGKIREEYHSTKKEMYSLIVVECQNKLQALFDNDDTLMPLFRDFIVANANQYNAQPRYELGQLVTSKFGFFTGVEYENYKDEMEQSLGIDQLSTY